MFKCKLWNYRCVLLCHAFHGLCGFLVGLAYLQTDLSVISFGSWMFAKSPVTVVSSLEKKAIQIHSVRIKLYYILWLHSLLKWMLTKYLTYFPFLFLSTSYSGQAAVNARLFFSFFFSFFYKDSLLIAFVSFDPYVSTLSDWGGVMDHQNKSSWIPICDRIWFEFRFVLSGSIHFSYCNILCLNIYSEYWKCQEHI